MYVMIYVCFRCTLSYFVFIYTPTFPLQPSVKTFLRYILYMFFIFFLWAALYFALYLVQNIRSCLFGLKKLSSCSEWIYNWPIRMPRAHRAQQNTVEFLYMFFSGMNTAEDPGHSFNHCHPTAWISNWWSNSTKCSKVKLISPSGSDQTKPAAGVIPSWLSDRRTAANIRLIKSFLSFCIFLKQVETNLWVTFFLCLMQRPALFFLFQDADTFLENSTKEKLISIKIFCTGRFFPLVLRKVCF